MVGGTMNWRFCILALFIFVLDGCIPFMTNEQQTRLWMSQEKRIEGYKRGLDFQVGREYYTLVPKLEWCQKHQCSEISDSITEYVEEFIDDASRKCVIAWQVDARQSVGNYQYGTGPVNYGLGKRLNWRYISKPEDCLLTLAFWGPD